MCRFTVRRITFIDALLLIVTVFDCYVPSFNVIVSIVTTFRDIASFAVFLASFDTKIW